MLQINTGKLFTHGIERTNRLRGVLYGNLRLPRETPIVTGAGTLVGTNGLRDNRSLIYELDERIENGPNGPGVLVSHGIDPFAIDFAAVASFAFNAVVAPDSALVDRLLSGKPNLAAFKPPRDFLMRCFDDRIWLTEEEVTSFVRLVDDLLALERRSFLAAMRAIRTYVSGVHRLGDDLGTAYTLMVSATESLAQGFDEHQTGWSDVDERKRRPVDAALSRASSRTAAKVREAIASTEHASLSRRYRAFVLAHLEPAYFRDQLAGERPIAAYEVEEALRQAYVQRSRYLHNLRLLPDAIADPFQHWEVAYVERNAVLTFQGLARLTRHVISAFIARGPKVEVEPYPYRREEAGVRFAEWAPQYWVGTPLRKAAEGRKRYEGFLSQLAGVMTNAPDAVLTDLRPMLTDVERLAPKASVANQDALFALYSLFNAIVVPDLAVPDYQAFIDRHQTLVERPSVESLVAFTILGELDLWNIETHQQMLDSYFEKRPTAKGLEAPRIFEAAICLTLAERYRSKGKADSMRRCVSRAVESAPGTKCLLDLEAALDDSSPIEWRKILLPAAVPEE